MRRADPRAALDSDQSLAADLGIKGLMPFHGRPFLDYVLRELAKVGIERVVLVVAPGASGLASLCLEVSKRCSDGPAALEVTAVVQEKPLGTADALSHCRRAIENEEFLLVNSDNFYPAEALEELASVEGMACLAVDADLAPRSAGGNLTAQRLRDWAVLDVDESGFLIRILEKPGEEALAALEGPRLASTNAWKFAPEIFDACLGIAPSPRGEFELPDAVQRAIDVMGLRFRVVPTRAPILDLSTRGDVAAVGRLLPRWY